MSTGDAAADATGPGDAATLFGWYQGTSDHKNNTSSLSVAFDSQQLAGDMILVVAAWDGSGAPTISDSHGNTYAQVQTTRSNGSDFQAIYYAANIAAGSNTVTLQLSQQAGTAGLRIAEYAGVVASNPLEHASLSSGSSTQMTLALLATANAHDLIVAANTVESSTTGIDASYASRLTDLGNVLFDKVVTQPGTYNASATQSTNSGWVFQIMAFKLN